MITAPGIYTDIDPAAYLADPCPAPSFTQSIAKVLIDQSPAHARLAHPRLSQPLSDDEAEPEKYVAAQAIGDAAHTLLIGRGKRIAVIDYPNFKKGDAQTLRDVARADGKTPILAKHMARAYAMVEAAKDQLHAAGHEFAFEKESEGAGEVVLAWREKNLWLRTMIDWIGPGSHAVYDFKSSGLSCAPHAVEDRPSVMGWDIQAAMHARGLDVLDPNNAGRREHFYVNQENEPPYALTVVEISEADMTLGRKKLAMAFSIWSACMSTGHWPLYPAETVMSRPRGYLETKWLEREVGHHERQKREPMLTDMSGG